MISTPLRAPIKLDSFVYRLLLLFIFTTPWDAAVHIGGTSTLTKYIGYVLFAVAIWSRILKSKVKRLSQFHMIFIFFIGYAFMTSLWSQSTSLTFNRCFEYLQMFVMTWVIWEFVNQRDRIYGLLKAYVLGSLVTAIDVAVNYFSGTTFMQSQYDPRFAAFGNDPNEVGLTIAIAVPFCWLLYLSSRGRIRGVWLLSLPILCFGEVMTSSRGSTLALVVAVGMVIFTFNKFSFRKRILAFFLLLLTGWAVTQFVPVTVWGRLGSIQSQIAHGYLSGRGQIWSAGMKAFSKSPIIGVGAGAFGVAIMPYYGTVIVAHNTFLSILVEDGLVGLVIFGVLLVNVFRTAVRQNGLFAWCWIASLLTWSVGVFALTWDYRKPTWLLLALVVASAGVFRSESKKVTEE